LILSLLPQLIWEKSLAKFGTFNSTMAIEHRKQAKTIVKLRLNNMRIFLRNLKSTLQLIAQNAMSALQLILNKAATSKIAFNINGIEYPSVFF
jgi:hypothetical protein